MLVVGVDPGLDGGIASYDGTELVLFEIPSLEAKVKGREMDYDAVSNAVATVFGSADHVVIEKVGAMPRTGAGQGKGQGTSSAFKFGYVAGTLFMAFKMMQVPISMVPPQTWKAWHKIPAAKDAAYARAAQLFPKRAQDFKGPKGGIKDGIAEAALLAYYGYQILTSGGRI